MNEFNGFCFYGCEIFSWVFHGQNNLVVTEKMSFNTEENQKRIAFFGSFGLAGVQ